MTDYDKALSAICAVLTPPERVAIVASAGRGYAGAEPADVLDALWQRDAYLAIREPFYDANPDLTGQPAASVALLAVISLGQRPARDRVIALIHRAGLADRIRRGDVTALAGEIGELAERTADMSSVATDLGSPSLADALLALAVQLQRCEDSLSGLAAATEE